MKESLFSPVDPDLVKVSCFFPCDLFIQNDDGTIELLHSRHESLENYSHYRLETGHPSPRMLIHKKDMTTYHSFTVHSLPKNIASDDIDLAVKTRLAYSAIRKAAVQFFNNPQAESFEIYEMIIRTVVSLAIKEPETTQLLLDMMTPCEGIANHNINVGIYGMGLTLKYIEKTDISDDNFIPALFYHDIGKSAVPPEVLNKDGRFTSVDRNFIRRHPENGLRMLRKITQINEPMRQVVLFHHERLNGSGYPSGMRGSAVSMYARISAVADVFEGLTSQRSYKNSRSTFEALKTMNTAMAGEFDPSLLALFVKLFAEKPLMPHTM